MASGEELELRVYSALQGMLRSGALGLNPKTSRLLHKARYFSKDRSRTLAVDIAIEIFMRGARDPSILWVWECKDWHGALDVGEVERFHATLEQIGRDRTKGTIVTSKGVLTPAAWNYAVSHGLGIARIMPEGKIVSPVACLPFFGLGLSANPWVCLALVVSGLGLPFAVRYISNWRKRSRRVGNSDGFDQSLGEARSAHTQEDFRSERTFFGVASANANQETWIAASSSFEQFARDELYLAVAGGQRSEI